MKIVNHHWRAETIPKLTVHSQLLLNYFLHAEILYFVNEEVRAGCPKLGRATLSLLREKNKWCVYINPTNVWSSLVQCLLQPRGYILPATEIHFSSSIKNISFCSIIKNYKELRDFSLFRPGKLSENLLDCKVGGGKT